MSDSEYVEGFTTLPYPERVWASASGRQTVEFLASTDCRVIAEIGVYRGGTSRKIAEHLNGEGELHLFDFEHRVEEAKQMLNQAGYSNIVAHGNSRKLLDSYNWSLMEVLREHEAPLFDYAFIDGAHTWGVDALAFLLVDRLLVPGGYVDFDDYDWTLHGSPSMNPRVFPATSAMYTEDQIKESQVRLVVDLLVRRDDRYTEVIENKVFRKGVAR